MKVIGLIGGMSWESSLEYYRILNQEVKSRLGGFHSAKIIFYSVDFNKVQELQHQEKWGEIGDDLADIAKKIENFGADILLLCTNTIHKIADLIAEHIEIPLLHIADTTAEKIKEQKLKKVGLLGTKFTMEEDFYKQRLSDKHKLEVLVPSRHDQQSIHKIIFDELVLGKLISISKDRIINIIHSLREKGAEGIILGCTELPLLIKQADIEIPLFDTMSIHAQAAVEFALG